MIVQLIPDDNTEDIYVEVRNMQHIDYLLMKSKRAWKYRQIDVITPSDFINKMHFDEDPENHKECPF